MGLMLIPLLFFTEPLHVVDSSKSTVLYRNGIELVNTKALLGKKQDRHPTTYGTFGPVMGAIRSALSIGVTWKRWESSADGGRRTARNFSICSPRGCVAV
jgi:hypothetical protein